MKIELTQSFGAETPILDKTLTERFKDPEHLISTLNAMKRRNPKRREELSKLTLHIRQGYKYRFLNGVVHCYTASVKMY